MALSYHVPGPIGPMVSVGGGGSLVTVGMCEEGADIDIQIAQHDVKHDGGGGQDGFEVENVFLNAVCVVRFTLVPYDTAFVNAIRAAANANATAGVMPVPGTLYGMNGFLHSLFLPSGDADGPWRFPYCRVVRAGNNRVNTKETKPQFEFRAINWFNPASKGSIVGNTLYQRS